MQNEEQEPKRIELQVQSDAGGADGGRPPRKTAIGTGDDSDSEFSPEDWSKMQEERRRTGEPIAVILARLGFKQPQHIKNALELQYGVNYVALNELVVDAQCAGILTEQMMRRYQVAVISYDGRRLSLAMVNPNDRSAFDAIKELTKVMAIKPFACTEEDWRSFMDRLPPTVAKQMADS